MKNLQILAALLFAGGLSFSASAQTPRTGTVPTPAGTTTPSANMRSRGVQTNPSGASIANNRDVTATGTGTPVGPAMTAQERQARKSQKDAQQNQKRQAKGKPMK